MTRQTPDESAGTSRTGSAPRHDDDAGREPRAEPQRMEDDDDELLADLPPHEANAAATTMPAPPPESNTMDVWTSMEHMTTQQSNAIRADISIVATHLDNKITTGLQTRDQAHDGLTTTRERHHQKRRRHHDSHETYGQARDAPGSDSHGAPARRPTTQRLDPEHSDPRRLAGRR